MPRPVPVMGIRSDEIEDLIFDDQMGICQTCGALKKNCSLQFSGNSSHGRTVYFKCDNPDCPDAKTLGAARVLPVESALYVGTVKVI